MDIDLKNGINGLESRIDLIGTPGAFFNRTTLVSTGSGGWRLWFTNPMGLDGRDGLRPGLDVKAANRKYGRYVVAPPTPGYTFAAPRLLPLVPGHSHRETTVVPAP